MAMTFFFMSRKKYVVTPPRGSILAQVWGVVGSACRARRAKRQLQEEHIVDGRPHWLDYAKLSHSIRIVEDIKAVLRVLPVFAVLVSFWACAFACVL